MKKLKNRPSGSGKTKKDKHNNQTVLISPGSPEEIGVDITSSDENTTRKKKDKLTKLEHRRSKGLIPKRLPEKLRTIRLHLNISQGKMLRAISPNEVEDNRARVSQWERGTRIPTVVEIWNYAKLVNIQMEILVDDAAELPF